MSQLDNYAHGNWDSGAIYHACYYYCYLLSVWMQGRSNKAIILLTYGHDSPSNYSLGDVISIARQQGVSIYPICIQMLPTDETDMKTLADSTGGKFYKVTTGEQIAQKVPEILSLIRKQDAGSILKYTSPCANGGIKTVDVILDSPVPPCVGLSTASSSYNANLIPSTLRPIRIQLQDTTGFPEDTVALPLVLRDTITTLLHGSSFDVIYDTSKITCLDMDTRSHLLNGISIISSPIPNGRRLTVDGDKVVAGPGILGKLIFLVDSTSARGSTDIACNNWTFTEQGQSCLLPNIQSGSLYVKNTLQLLQPNNGDTLCTLSQYTISWSPRGGKGFDLLLSTNGGQLFDTEITHDVKGKEFVWTVPDTLAGINNCVIKVKSHSDTVCDISDRPFVIRKGYYVAQHPADQLVCEGGFAIARCQFQGNPKPAVNWQTSMDSGTTWKDVVGFYSDSLVIKTATNSDTIYVRAFISTSCGVYYTNAARIMVKIKPRIIAALRDTAVCPAQDVIFRTAVLDNIRPEIEWQSSSDSGKTWNILFGETNDSLVIRKATTSMSGIQYRYHAVSECDSFIFSNSAILRVGDNVAIIQQPTDVFACLGGDAQFNVVADVLPYAEYEWQRSSDSGGHWDSIPSSNNGALVVQGIKQSDDQNLFRVIIRNTCGSSNTSSHGKLILEGPITITKNPIDQRRCEGDSVRFSVAYNSLRNPTKVWQRSTDSGLHFTDLLGTDLDTLLVQNVSLKDSGDVYRVKILNSCGEFFSTQAVLSVVLKTAIIINPVSQTIRMGDSVSFIVKATGSNLSFKWLKDGVIISGATSPIYSIGSAGKNDEGNYSVVVDGDCGSSLISAVASLSVNITAINDGYVNPSGFILEQNRPNPFRDQTIIRFYLPRSTEIKLSVYDVYGREIVMIEKASREQGWHEVTFQSDNLPSGVYFYRLFPAKNLGRQMLFIR